MSYKQMTGNIISATKVEPAGAFQNSVASGVWNLQDQYDYRRGGNWPETGNALSRAIFFDGVASLQYVEIATTGNTLDFGDGPAVSNSGGTGSNTRGVFKGSDEVAIYQIQWATLGNSTSFGDLTVGHLASGNAASTTRAIFGGGGTSNVMEYITIASAGDGTDFGDLTVARGNLTGFSSAAGRAAFSGGRSGNTYYNTIDYVAIASTGNATDFGNLSANRARLNGFSSATRGVVGGGGPDANNSNKVNIIEYITIGSTGNMTDFGNLSAARSTLGGASSSVRGIFAGGSNTSGTKQNIMEYVTIASTGDVTDFGDLDAAKDDVGGMSSDHGGLQ